MSKEIHPIDHQIIRLLQDRGLIKSEAKQKIKREVYKLSVNEVDKLQSYSTHFGFNAKQKLIDEILDIRRDEMLNRLIGTRLNN